MHRPSETNEVEIWTTKKTTHLVRNLIRTVSAPLLWFWRDDTSTGRVRTFSDRCPPKTIFFSLSVPDLFSSTSQFVLKIFVIINYICYFFSVEKLVVLWFHWLKDSLNAVKTNYSCLLCIKIRKLPNSELVLRIFWLLAEGGGPLLQCLMGNVEVW